MSVSIQGLDKAAVLAALYNGARAQGMGFLQYDPKPMGVEEAVKLLENDVHFYYLKGRVMKISLEGDTIREDLYDRDNGAGSCVRIIDSLRQSPSEVNPEIAEIAHKENTRNAAMIVSEHLYDPTDLVEKGKVAHVHMGLGDVSDLLKPYIDKVLNPSEPNETEE